MKIALVLIEELIFEPGPCIAGKNLAWMMDGLAYPRRGATSRENLKYGS
jgi:hypothetical protein